MTKLQDWSIGFGNDAKIDIDQNNSDLENVLYQALRYKNVLEALLKITDVFIYIKDAQHKFMFTSDAFARLTGHDSWKELVGKDDFDIFPEEHAKVYFEHEEDVIKKGKTLGQHEEPYYNDKGELCWVCTTKNPVFDDAGNVVGLIGISKDITQMKKHQEIIAHQATHDYLTSVYNRKAFYEFGETMWSKLKREKQQSMMLFIDLNDFKNVNDQHGHQEGDRVLCRFAKLLKHECRESDLLARIGGDEFVLYMSGEKHAASKLVDRLIKESRQKDLKGCQVSIGIASSLQAKNLSELVRQADEAMYFAKRSKFEQFCFYPGAE
ncbi:sensor domain-containing diguanylate cyclase [Pseudoteredinibacter isoporae]|uniref:Diguanylate cyclase (GGDEF)-like protein/PAS domain S-box-containing protein n=1 Tax=Pseudoteredinibacter isoporae TaxID=570281 RepID=A0A7X0JVJ8_9GAMM|nr:sensor domain-containing diguanylate cyclase [Pseudoteredinibacter isoporae]MBB6523059.1 diguanylate cyclase (GGDEF)-like protein/PAS domain S-box-containing protein [Pseudoteredinibacter isoporae]NHO88579.1 sensor domain-containing diguanylate cyclase [Pseudoteredinibacter isoporae]NIB22730.1 sensor domain-containing diguanylate cyclase [Pseudoteredinibacter isoporae]